MEDKKAITLRGSCHHALMTYDPSWLDRTSAWWAKADRAHHHLRSLGRQVEEFRASKPYTVVPQATDTPGRTEYRLRVDQPMPVEISTTVGDVLHNLRSALDSLAYEVARRGLNRPMTIEEQAACAFPVRATPESFDRFFDETSTSPRTRLRSALYRGQARAAFRSVQPSVFGRTRSAWASRSPTPTRRSSAGACSTA
jgi:hypothetical protein